MFYTKITDMPAVTCSNVLRFVGNLIDWLLALHYWSVAKKKKKDKTLTGCSSIASQQVSLLILINKFEIKLNPPDF